MSLSISFRPSATRPDASGNTQSASLDLHIAPSMQDMVSTTREGDSTVTEYKDRHGQITQRIVAPNDTSAQRMSEEAARFAAQLIERQLGLRALF